MRQLVKDEFIQRARKAHGNRYNYDKVDYVNNNTKVCIICPEHGEFWQTPRAHFSGQGCPKCGVVSSSFKRSLLETEFIQKAKQIHGDKYDYNKVNYVNSHIEACIICKKHGEFWQTPTNHLAGKGCPKCANEDNRLKHCFSNNEFIERAKKIHGEKYDYSCTNYVYNHTVVEIMCN